MSKTTVLIIDNEIKLTKSLAFTLRQANMHCLEAHDGYTGFRIANAESPDVILLDVRMPGKNGLEILEQLKTDLPHIPVIMMSAFDDTKDAVTAMKKGAVDYLSKPFDVDELIHLLEVTGKQKQLEGELNYHRERFIKDYDFIGLSPTIRTLREKIDKIAASNVTTLLLLGETGVGKAVVAKQVHAKGSGTERPFVEINCATLPQDRIEAELFGAEKGSLPGVKARRQGVVEIASGGTLFLDEIGEMPLPVQAKLLTFLETRTYRPVGVARDHHANLRVIAATNKNLEKAVRQETFRRDLFFRLTGMPLHIPPLRERGKDIENLALFFARQFAEEKGHASVRFAKSTLSFFYSYDWPGNVRELKNLVERLSILHPGQVISVDQLPVEIKKVEPKGPVSIDESMQGMERTMIQEALVQCGGKKGIAAERLGISRHALKRKMQRLGLS